MLLFIYYGYFMIFSHFGLFSRIKLRLKNTVFEMQLNFHVCGSNIRRPAFVCSKVIFVKFIHVNTKKSLLCFIHTN